jgi:hypothetical protein
LNIKKKEKEKKRTQMYHFLKYYNSFL